MRLTRPFVLLALAALLAPRIEASRTGVWERNPPASLTTTTTAEAGLLASLAPPAAAGAVADAETAEPPRFDLGEVVLVERELEREDGFGLGPLDLLGPAPLRGPPPSYPETRVGGLELLPPFRVGASPTLSLWSRQACGFSCGEGASDSRYDPWGLKGGPADWLKERWTAARSWWLSLGAKSRESVESGLDETLSPPPDPTSDPYGAREAFRQLGYEGQYNREKSAKAGTEVRRDAIRAAGATTRGAVEAGKFWVENKTAGIVLGAVAKWPGRWATATESMSARAAAYQSQISGRAAGEVFLVNGVKFDAIREGVLLEAKGPGYARFVKNGEFRDWFNGVQAMRDQAARQVRVAGTTPIEWHVAEKDAVGPIRDVLADAGFGSRIKVVYTPPVAVP